MLTSCNKYRIGMKRCRLTKRSLMRKRIFFAVIPKKLSNKQSKCRWLQMPKPWRRTTVQIKHVRMRVTRSLVNLINVLLTVCWLVEKYVAILCVKNNYYQIHCPVSWDWIYANQLYLLVGGSCVVGKSRKVPIRSIMFHCANAKQTPGVAGLIHYDIFVSLRTYKESLICVPIMCL